MWHHDIELKKQIEVLATYIPSRVAILTPFGDMRTSDLENQDHVDALIKTLERYNDADDIHSLPLRGLYSQVMKDFFKVHPFRGGPL